MSLQRLLTQTVTIIEPGSMTDRYGNTVEDWDTAEETDTVGLIQQGSQQEQFGNRDAKITGARLFLTGAETISARCRVRQDDRLYEVDGDPAFWPQNGGHLEVNLLAVTG